MHFDDMLKLAGEFGPFQKIQCVALFLIIVNTTMHAFNMVFTTATPQHRCLMQMEAEQKSYISTNNFSMLGTGFPVAEVNQSCSMYVVNGTVSPLSNDPSVVLNSSWSLEKCQFGWSYDTATYTSTIVSEWDMVCDHDWYRTVITSVFFAGRLIGTFMFGQLSDRFGRKPIFIVCLSLLVLSGFLASFSKSVWMFITCVIFEGIAQLGLFICALTLATEIVGPSYRVLSNIILGMAFGVGEIFLAGIAFLLRRWNYLLLTVSLVGVPLMATFWFVPESVRWLLTEGRKEDACLIVQKIAKRNGKVLEHSDIMEKLAMKNQRRRSSLIDFARSPSTAKLSFILWFQTAAMHIVYYGLVFNTPNLAGDPYLNFAILGSAEAVAAFLLLGLRKRFSQKVKYLVLTAIAGVISLVLPFLPKEYRWLSVVLAFTGKVGAFGAGIYHNVMSMEAYPTTMRNTALGLGKTFSMLGAVISPYVLYLSKYMDEMPGLVMGALSFIAVLLGFIMPETSGLKLPQTIDDMLKVGKQVQKEQKEIIEHAGTTVVFKQFQPNKVVITESGKTESELTKQGSTELVTTEAGHTDIHSSEPIPTELDQMELRKPGLGGISLERTESAESGEAEIVLTGVKPIELLSTKSRHSDQGLSETETAEPEAREPENAGVEPIDQGPVVPGPTVMGLIDSATIDVGLTEQPNKAGLTEEGPTMAIPTKPSLPESVLRASGEHNELETNEQVYTDSLLSELVPPELVTNESGCTDLGISKPVPTEPVPTNHPIPEIELCTTHL